MRYHTWHYKMGDELYSVILEPSEHSVDLRQLPEDIGELEMGCFRGRKGLDTIILDDCTHTIGEEAFLGCEKLKNVQFSPNLKRIREDAFRDCTALEEIDLSQTKVEMLENNVFTGCVQLKRVTLPAGFRRIWKGAFTGCLELEEVDLSQTAIYSIEDDVFHDCKKLKTIRFPETLSEIGDRAFSGCISLEEILFPSKVKKIYQNAFSGCVALKSVYSLEGVQSLGSFVFDGCVSLTYFQHPETLTNVGLGAFRKCPVKNLPEFLFSAEDPTILVSCHSQAKEVVIPDGIRRIAYSALSCLNNMETVRIPSSVVSIGHNSFSDCQALKYVYLPDSVQSITHYTFAFSKNIDMISISSHTQLSHTEGDRKPFFSVGLKKLEIRGFPCPEWIWDMTNDDGEYNGLHILAGSLSMTDFPKDLRENVLLGFFDMYVEKRYMNPQVREYYMDYVRKRRKKLLEAYPQNATMLRMMMQEKLIRVEDIENVISKVDGEKQPDLLAELIEYQQQFSQRDYEKIEERELRRLIREAELESDPTSPVNLKKLFPIKTIDGKHYISRYKGSSTNVVYPDKIGRMRIDGIADAIMVVPDNYKKMESVVIPEGYTYIGKNAFFGCGKLQSVQLPDSLIEIRENAFLGCESLQEITIPDNTVYLGRRAFEKCRSLWKVKLGKGITELETDTFSYCLNLTTIDICNVKSLEEMTFDMTPLARVIFRNLDRFYQNVAKRSGSYETPKRIISLKDQKNRAAAQKMLELAEVYHKCPEESGELKNLNFSYQNIQFFIEEELCDFIEYYEGTISDTADADYLIYGEGTNLPAKCRAQMISEEEFLQRIAEGVPFR